MKMIDKKDCEYKGGYIVNDGKVVCVDNEVVDLLNKLEEDVQRKQFEDTSKPLCFDMPVGEFVRKTERGKVMPHVEAKTPELDKMVENTLKIMDEVDDIHNAELINEYFSTIVPVVMFADDDFIVSCEHGTQHRFDLPTIGNPLELTKDDLAEFVMSLYV